MNGKNWPVTRAFESWPLREESLVCRDWLIEHGMDEDTNLMQAIMCPWMGRHKSGGAWKPQVKILQKAGFQGVADKLKTMRKRDLPGWTGGSGIGVGKCTLRTLTHYCTMMFDWTNGWTFPSNVAKVFQSSWTGTYPVAIHHLWKRIPRRRGAPKVLARCSAQRLVERAMMFHHFSFHNLEACNRVMKETVTSNGI